MNLKRATQGPGYAFTLALLTLLLLAGCSAGREPTATPTATPRPATPTATTSVAQAPAEVAARPTTGDDPADDPVASEEPSATPSPSPSTSPTPTASSTPTATATPTATDMPTATPTTPPSQQLAEAIHLHDVGDYAAARQAYAALLREQPEGPEAGEARWRLGLAYLEDDEPAEAAIALELAREEVPSEVLPAEVDFWLGQAYEAIDAPLQAVEAYRGFLERQSLLAGPVNLRIGRQLVAAGDMEGAAAALQAAVDTAPDNFILFAAQEELADLFREQGDNESALAQLDQILAVSQYARYRAEIQHRAGQILEQAGQPDAAIDRYRQALAEDTAAPYALQATYALQALGQPVDDYTLARVLLGNGAYADGIAAMYRYFEAVPDHPAEPHLLVAEAYFSQRNYPAALAEWQVLLDTHPEYGDRAGVLSRMATAQARLDNSGVARDLYRQAAAASTAQAPAALLEAARLAERDQDCITAATEYLDVARLYPSASAAGEALYRGGMCQYRLGQLTGAVESWQRLVSGYPANTYAHAGRFWAGKALLELGDPTQAVELWRGLADEAADSYYVARAVELARQAGIALEMAGSDAVATVAGQDPAVQPEANSAAATGTNGNPANTEDVTALLAEAEAWLATWAAPGVADPASLRRLPAAVAADTQLMRGEAYLRAGLRGEALQAFDEVHQRYKDDPLSMYALSLYFRDLGAYKHATLAGVRLAALGPGGLLEAPLFVQRLAYPTYFADLVEAEAAARGLDPYLIYSLIRQESFFERGARSFAAAQGLTQVIPSTAEWIADAMGWPGFEPDDIYKPYINVKFGTYYLWAGLEMFDGNPYPALVGYNAGPGNARYWLDEANSDDVDLYVETISLAEPKLYVRRVLAHYYNYLRLYGGEG